MEGAKLESGRAPAPGLPAWIPRVAKPLDASDDMG